MSLIGIILALVVVGIVLWLVESYIPMPASIKRLIEIVAVIIIVLWLLQVLGILGAGDTVRVAPIR